MRNYPLVSLCLRNVSNRLFTFPVHANINHTVNCVIALQVTIRETIRIYYPVGVSRKLINSFIKRTCHSFLTICCLFLFCCAYIGRRCFLFFWWVFVWTD